MWNFRGTPEYLDAQARRLGITKVIADRARRNPEIHRVSTLIGPLAELYQKARREGKPVAFLGVELTQIRGTLAQGEQEAEKLHVLAAASRAMLDEAHAAFGLEPPERFFGVTCAFDEPVNPPGESSMSANGTCPAGSEVPP